MNVYGDNKKAFVVVAAAAAIIANVSYSAFNEQFVLYTYIMIISMRAHFVSVKEIDRQHIFR